MLAPVSAGIEDAMGQAVTVERDGVHMMGYLAEPPGTPRAGVVTIHEGWGLNDNIRGIAERFAAESIARIRVPVMGSYGSLDQGIPKEQVDMLRDTLAQSGAPHDVKLYEGAHHGFFNDTRDIYDPAASADSWTRTLEWFGRHLAA